MLAILRRKTADLPREATWIERLTVYNKTGSIGSSMLPESKDELARRGIGGVAWGNTSEFSECAAVNALTGRAFEKDGLSRSAGQPDTFDYTAARNGVLTVQVFP